MEKVKLGIIGYGNMGTGHANNLMSSKVAEMELAAVCDISAERRKVFSDAYPDIPVFETAEDLYKSGLCDTVLIAVPHYDHSPLAIKAFENIFHITVTVS